MDGQTNNSIYSALAYSASRGKNNKLHLD